MKIAVIFGTRPEIIKLSALVKLAAEAPGVDLEIIHTGQHYSYNLSERFLEDLDLPHIQVDIAVGSMERLDQVRKMVGGLTPELERARPEVVVVQGDTNSTLAGAIAGRNLGIPVAHVEAGLRCFDPLMTEEINRIAVDRISDMLFAPTTVAVQNMLAEGHDRARIHMVGNTVVEVVTLGLEHASVHSSIVDDMGLEPEHYILVTAHRQENVDDEPRLRDLVTALGRIAIPMVYPVHPRTCERIVEFELLHVLEAIGNLTLTDPLSYFDFLELARQSRMIISDSGGIQEECTVFKKPIVVVRENTERPEILGIYGDVVGSNPHAIVAAVGRIDSNYGDIIAELHRTPTPYGDGKASERILETILAHFP